MNSTSTDIKSSLPSRLRESSFRTYERHIHSAVVAFPNVVIFMQKDDSSLITFASRLRDAMASLVMYRWTSDKIDMDRFDELYPKIKVSHVVHDRVVVGSIEAIKQYYKDNNIKNLPPSQFESFTPSPALKVSASTPLSSSVSPEVIPTHVPLSQDVHDKGVELKLLAGLAALRLLSQPVVLEIDVEQAQWLEDNYDVVLNKQDDGKHTMH